MNRRAVCWAASAALSLGMLTAASARPQYLMAFKAHYKTSEGKPTLDKTPCVVCHVGAPPQKNFNVYGAAFQKQLGAANVQDRAKIVAALTAIETQKNASANKTFRELINADALPGIAQAGGGTGAVPGRPPVTATGDWIPLYNGVNMEGWKVMNQGNWKVENMILKYTGGGNGWLRSNTVYDNYSAVIVWRYPEAAANNDSGIFLKAKTDTGSPWPSSPQLNMGPGDNLGSIGGAQGTRSRADLIKPNDWNTYQVTVQNGMAILYINGQKAWDQATGLPTGPGYLGIQAENRPIDIAQFWVMKLP